MMIRDILTIVRAVVLGLALRHPGGRTCGD